MDDADALDLSATTALKSGVTFMFHWSGGQSGNISNIEVGKAFIVDLRDDSTKLFTGNAQ
ncbi:MAG: hypothetical protein K2K12_04105 [Clostridia bacterium]|nr:hypothetical protein [Clostridia bacterium]